MNRDLDTDGGELASRLTVLVERALTPASPGAPRHGREVARALARWAALVLEWNERIDLTAARNHEELVDLLVADAAAVAAAGVSLEEAWVDVGSGAGAPGLALALLCPGLAITLVEPKAKRVAFLRTVIGELGVPGASVLRARGEAVVGAGNRRETAPAAFGTAISRATLPPPAWLALGAHLARNHVWVLLAREDPPDLAGWKVDTRFDYQWPLTGAWRRACRYSPCPP